MKEPTAFGKRVAALRQSLGLTQSGIDGINQPRLSKIESGQIAASADMIEKLAAAFDRAPVALVQGTDREGYYLGERLKPEQRSELDEEKRFMESALLELLYVHYKRVWGLFHALYGGNGIVPQSNVDTVYVQLRANGEKLVAAIEEFRPGFTEHVFFPDHLEPENEFDDLLMGGEVFQADIKKSLRYILTAIQEYGGLNEEAVAALERAYSLDQFDLQIAKLETDREEIEKHFWETTSKRSPQNL